MRFLFILLLLLTAVGILKAQDTIRKINGKMILARIDSVGRYEVSFRYNSYSYEKKGTLSKSVIADITYADGRCDTFFVMKNNMAAPGSPMLHLADNQLYALGAKDAKRYYSGYSGASTGTLLATFPGSPALGLIIGASCSLTPPKDKNLGFPNVALQQNSQYHDGYYTKARKIKNGKIWSAFGVGVLANVAVFLILNQLKQ